MPDTHQYRVAGITFRISFADLADNDSSLLPSFKTFETAVGADHDSTNDRPLFHLSVEESLHIIKDCELIRNFDTGNGHTAVYRLADGGYQYLIHDIKERPCCLLQTDKCFTHCRCALKGTHDMRSYGLNNAIMLVYAFAGSSQQALLIHASCIMNKGMAYPFIARSGTGKSTHSSLWLQHIEGSELMNDDNPVVRIVGNKAVLYGSPWSGKTPCYKNIEAPIGAIVRIERAKENKIQRLSSAEAFASLLPSCSSMKWDEEIYNNICNTVTTIVSHVPSFTLYCLPDEDAARLCHNTITK